MQPVPTVSRTDVERVVLRDFPTMKGSDVLEILDAYASESSNDGRARVQLAALKLANGSLDELRRQIDAARSDFRDTIASAEYPRASRDWSRLSHMSAVDRQETYDADWHEYKRWFEHHR